MSGGEWKRDSGQQKYTVALQPVMHLPRFYKLAFRPEIRAALSFRPPYPGFLLEALRGALRGIKTVRPHDHNLAQNARELRGVYYTSATESRLSEASTGVDYPLPFWSRGFWAQQGPNGCSVASGGRWNRYRNKGTILSGRIITNTKPSPAKDRYNTPLPRWLVVTKIDSAARCFAWFATVVKFKVSHLSSRRAPFLSRHPINSTETTLVLRTLWLAVADIEMQIRKALLGLASLCGLVLPASGGRVNNRDRTPRGVPSSHTVHERHARNHLRGWVKRGLVDAETSLPVRIGLRQSNVDAAHDRLMDM